MGGTWAPRRGESTRRRATSTQSPSGPPRWRCPRQTHGALPAASRQQLVQQSCTERKGRRLPASSPAREAPALPSPRFQGPIHLTAPGTPHPGSPAAPRPRPGFPRPRRPPGAPEGGDGRAGGGAAPARRPPRRPHAPSRPRSFPAFPV